MKQVLILIFLLCVNASQCYAMQLAEFSDYDLSDIKYENRIRISNDTSDFDYETDLSQDINHDGIISSFEENTFFSSGDESSVYVGNAHSSYALNNALLWIGISGQFESFKVDDMEITSANVTPANSLEIVWPYQEVIPYVDSVALIDIESSVIARASSADPVSSSNPFTVTLNSLVTDDNDFYAYISGYGSIKSGFNSVSPKNSDLLWQPASAPVAPEPGSMVLFGIGGLGLLIKRKLLP